MAITTGQPDRHGARPPGTGAARRAAAGLTLSLRPLIFLTLVLAGAVAMGEIDRLVADIMDTSGARSSFAEMFGPGRALHPRGGQVVWELWRGQLCAVRHFLDAYLVANVVFMVGVVGAVFSVVRSRLVVIVVAVAVVLDVVEGLGARLVLDSRAGWSVSGLGFVTLVKWVTYLWLFLIVGRRVWSPENRARLGRIGYGLVRQRFSLLALLPIAALGIAPGSDLLDQLPDVERRWLDGGVGPVHLGAACVTLLLLAGALFVLGRLRSDCIWRRATDEGPRLAPTPKPTLWIVVAVVVLVFAVVVRALGGVIDWWPVAFVVGIVLSIPGVSEILRRCGGPVGVAAWNYEDERVARTVIGVGDALAVLTMVIAGIGLVRAFTAPLVLPTLSGSPDSGGLSSVAGPLVCVMVGLAAAAVWPLAGALLRQLDTLALRPQPRWWVEVITPGLPEPEDGRLPRRARTTTRIALAMAGVGLLGALGIIPGWAAAHLGLIACVVVAVTGLVTVLGVVVVVSQERPPQQLFRWIGLRTAPLVTLILIVAAVTWYRSDNAGLHGIRDLGRPTRGDSRPTLDTAFAQWMSTSTACDSQVVVQEDNQSRPVQLRPMVLVAAEGGGIRAAYWTASVFEKMTSSARGHSCGQQAVFLSSGVSGGSVGLAVAATNNSPADAAGKLSAPDALSAAAIGLLVRDDIASVTGIRLPALDHTGGRGWHDRAALMESIWEQQAPGLQHPFIDSNHPGTGQLIFNSTSVGTSCRVLVSQIRLDNTTHADAPPRPAAGDPPCRSGTTVAPATFDLLTDYANRSVPDSGDQCVQRLSMVTAAMLSARFAYITPSGVVGPCNNFTGQQLIDGGYAEGTGLGTLIDLAPRWMSLVRKANDAVLTTLQTPPMANSKVPVFVIPVIVLLKNSSGSDITPSASKLTTEVQVPLRGKEAAAAQTDTNTLLQRAAQLTDRTGLCAPAASDLCTQLINYSLAAVPQPVILVAPDTTPTITAPLGWALSQDSRTTLRFALGEQSKIKCASPSNNAVCAVGYGRLADLLTEIHESPNRP